MKIIIVLFGLLGDVLVAIPALWRLKALYPQATVHLISEKRKTAVDAQTVLQGAHLIDRFHHIQYPFNTVVLNKIFSRLHALVSLLPLKRHSWDLGVVLASGNPPCTQTIIERRKKILRFIGVKKILAPSKIHTYQYDDRHFLKQGTHEVHAMLALIESLNPNAKAACKPRLDLNLTPKERLDVGCWIEKNNLTHTLQSSPWIALGIGTNMPSKQWPVERYDTLVGKLIDEHNVLPVIIGSRAQHNLSQDLIKKWQRGIAVLGQPIRFVSGLMDHCAFYLGNDTGVMHLAVASGLQCVALFSSRTIPGVWYPYGQGHCVFRTQIPCEGCELTVCAQHDNQCLKAIPVGPVLDACQRLIKGL